MSSNIGDRIGDYEVVGILGAGGMGRVYKVRNVISDRIEAMKVLLPDLAGVPELADRFTREIKVLAGLEHPNIAALRTAQRVGNQLIMVMELVEGVTLQEKLENGPITAPEALDYISQVLAALSYAHQRGVIHRDIKPANMMVTAGGTVKLMDFGIAKAAGDRKLTMTGTTMGSLYYMSPEQIRGAELDARSDLYSLGVSLYEIVTGARPFQGDSDFSIMSAHLEKQPVPPIEVDPKLPAPLNAIILMSISKEPAKRFQSADAFRAAMMSVMGDLGVPVAAPAVAARQAEAPKQPAAPAVKPPAPVAQPQAARTGHRGLYIVLGAAVAIAALVIGAIEIPKWRNARASEKPPAVQQAAPATPIEQPPPQPPPAAEPTAQAQPEQPVPPPASQPQGSRRVVRGATPAPPAAPVESAPQQAVQSPPPQPPPASPPNAAAQAAQAALKDLRKNWPMVASRAAAVRTSLQNLQNQQQNSGLSLRGDMSASWKRMEHYMDETEAAFSAKDADAAKENMDNVERELGTLEKFLGR